MLNLAKSSYYYKTKEQDEAKLKTEADIQDRIEHIACEFPRYGYRRITKQLKREGVMINHKKVLRIMRENSLLCVAKRKWINTTDSNHSFRRYPNLAKNLCVHALNQLWVADITYIRILTAFVYLAVILDAFSRKAIGYALSKSLEDDLTIHALRSAIAKRQPCEGCVHHSDQGIQYASYDYTDILKEHGFQISMSGKGNPYDNAMAESFMKTLKQEEVYLWDYKTIDDVAQRIPFFIEQVYNAKRLHSSLDYVPPDEFELNFLNKDQCSESCQLIAI
jgi:putative transposase